MIDTIFAVAMGAVTIMALAMTVQVVRDTVKNWKK